MFDDKTIKEIWRYVYALKDPRNWEIFYIGRWKENRIFQHAKDALKTNKSSDKLDKIREIINEWYNVEYFLIRHGLPQDVMEEVEATLIEILDKNRNFKFNITNLVQWSHTYDRWIINTNEAMALYWGKKINITDPVMLININKLFKRNMSEEELYNVTRQSWKVWENKNKVKYVLVHYKWIIREIYKIKNRYSVINKQWQKRWAFNWIIADDTVRDKYLYGLVKNFFSKWAAYPIRYINCDN